MSVLHLFLLVAFPWSACLVLQCGSVGQQAWAYWPLSLQEGWGPQQGQEMEGDPAYPLLLSLLQGDDWGPCPLKQPLPHPCIPCPD